jgi:nucleoside-diphosphate-sugar epimerase
MNIACGESHNILALVDEVNRQLGTRFAANYLPDRKGDVKHSFADISKARSVGYEPEVDFQEGIARTIDYYRQAIKRSE